MELFANEVKVSILCASEQALFSCPLIDASMNEGTKRLMMEPFRSFNS